MNKTFILTLVAVALLAWGCGDERATPAPVADNSLQEPPPVVISGVPLPDQDGDGIADNEGQDEDTLPPDQDDADDGTDDGAENTKYDNIIVVDPLDGVKFIISTDVEDEDDGLVNVVEPVILPCLKNRSGCYQQFGPQIDLQSGPLIDSNIDNIDIDVRDLIDLIR